jgi:hypothetical protein
MLRFLRDHVISTILIVCCLCSLLTQSVTGYLNYNDDARQHKQPVTTYTAYLVSGDFWETAAENWEGEFIPLAAYVLLTGFLLEKGAKESRKPGQKQEEQQVGSTRWQQTEEKTKQLHWSERHGPLLRWLYEHSIFLTFFGLFLFSFVLHILKGVFSLLKVPGKERKHLLTLYIEWANKPEPGFRAGMFSYTRLG